MAEQDIYAAIRKLKQKDPEPEPIHYSRGQNPNSQKNLRNGNSKGISGKTWVSKDGQEEFIEMDKLETYLADGWINKRAFKRRKSKRSEQIRELEEQVQNVLISLSKQ